MAQGLDLTIDFKKKAGCESPLPETAHRDLVDQLRSFYLVGGMPAAVTEWVETRSGWLRSPEGTAPEVRNAPNRGSRRKSAGVEESRRG